MLLTVVNSVNSYKSKYRNREFDLQMLITSVKGVIFEKFSDISVGYTPLLMLFWGFYLYYVKLWMLITNNKSLYRWI